MHPYNDVTKEQIKKWWVLSNKLGHNRARWTTFRVTKGISSLTHPSMTKTKMSTVLDVLSQEAAAQDKPVSALNSQGKVIHLVNADQLAAIDLLKKNLKLTREGYCVMCQRVLKKNCPVTYQDAVILMRTMAQAISESRSK